jgi:hypothetical protein
MGCWADKEPAQVKPALAKKRERHHAAARALDTPISQFPVNLLLSPFGNRAKQFLPEQGFSAS